MQLRLPISLLLTPLLLLLTTPTSAHHQVHTSTYIEIEQTLAKFPIAVDNKDYTKLSEVFTADGVFEAGLPTGPLRGLAAIETWLLAGLNNTLSQHSFGTQSIAIHDDEGARSADAVTYFIATFVGVGDKAGSGSLYNHAKYLDLLILNEDREWRVANKTLVYMIPSMGNTTLL